MCKYSISKSLPIQLNKGLDWKPSSSRSGLHYFFVVEKTGLYIHRKVWQFTPFSLQRPPSKKKKLQTSPCKEHPVALVAGGRGRSLGADHPPDEEAAEFRNGTKRSISGKPTCRIDDERAGQARWPSAITSPVKKGTDATDHIHPTTPEKRTPRRGCKPPDKVGSKHQPGLPSW